MEIKVGNQYSHEKKFYLFPDIIIQIKFFRLILPVFKDNGTQYHLNLLYIWPFYTIIHTKFTTDLHSYSTSSSNVMQIANEHLPYV